MQYKYRWYYVCTIFLSVVLTGYFCDVQQGLAEMAALRETENQIMQDLSALRELASHHHAEFPGANSQSNLNMNLQPARLAELFALAHASGLTIQSVNLLERQPLVSASIEMVHLVATGNFIQVASFLFSISSKSTIALMTDFSYKAEQGNKFIINMELILWQDNRKQSLPEKNSKNKTLLFNPFCSTPNEVMSKVDITLLQQIPINQIKMIGYLQQADRIIAIVSLPNDAIIDITTGFILGKEQGVVKEIKCDRIVVEVDGKKRCLPLVSNQ